nr:uncharacterized protein LOC123569046 [Macaca fascicularis]
MLERQTIGETRRNKRPFATISVGCVARSLRGGLGERVRKEGEGESERFRVSGTCQAPEVCALPSQQGSEERFVWPLHAPHLHEALSAPGATWLTAWSSPTLPQAETPPSGSGRPSVVPQPGSTFVKVCLPATHSPTRTLHASAAGDGLGDLHPERRTILLIYIFSNQGHGSRGGKWATLVPAGKCTQGAGQKPRRRQGSEADSSPGSPRPAGSGPVGRLPHLLAHGLRCAPHLAARPGEVGGEQPPGCAASRRLERVLTHRGVLPPAQGPVGFLRRVSCSQRERKMVSSGQVGRRFPIHSRDSAAGARGPSEPTGGQARAWLQRQPPPLRSSPHMHPARRAAGRGSTVSRGRRAGTPGGRLRNGSSVGRKVVFGIIFPPERDGT